MRGISLLLCAFVLGTPVMGKGVTFVIPFEHSIVYLRNTLSSIQEILEGAEVLIVPVGPLNEHDSVVAAKEVARLRKLGAHASILEGGRSLASALNMGATATSTDHVVFLSDAVEVEAGTVMELLDRSRESNAVVASRIDEPYGVTAFAGVHFKMGTLAKKSSWSYSYNDEEDDDDALVGLPVDRWRGASSHDRRVTSDLEVDAARVSVFGVVPRATFESVGGFDDEAYNTSLFDVDFCLRAGEMGVPVVYLGLKDLPAPVVYPDAPVRGLRKHVKEEVPSWQAKEDRHGVDSSEDLTAFVERWGAPLASRITAAYEVPGVTLVWNMECGLQQTQGFTAEALAFLLAMEDRMPLAAQVTSYSQCCDLLRGAGFPEYALDTVSRLYHKSGRLKGNTNMTILVIHRDPGRYPAFLDRSMEDFDADTVVYTVGRSMYETDSIEDHWVTNINDDSIDEVWVPSAFNLATFTGAGCERSKLRVVGEHVDVDRFDPSRATPLSLPQGSMATYRFLSIFKWEPRKGWDVLMRAYFEEFSDEDVLLYARVRMDDGNIAEFNEFVNRTEQELGRALPEVVLLKDSVPYQDLPSLYLGAQCFVLPTRGEGWGLPIMEAMAMSRPVIATNFSGTTAFLTEANSFPLAYSLTNASIEGHQWAEASVAELRRLMRHVYTNPEEAGERAARARRDVADMWSFASASANLLNVVREIRDDHLIPRAAAKREERERIATALIMGGQKCFRDYPYVYSGGGIDSGYCCAVALDCNGSVLTSVSDCCAGHDYRACPSPPCVNYNVGRLADGRYEDDVANDGARPPTAIVSVTPRPGFVKMKLIVDR